MKSKATVLSGLAGLLLGVSMPAALAQQAQPAPQLAPLQQAPVQQAPPQSPAGAQVDSHGNVVAPGAASAFIAPLPPPTTACLQLHLGGVVFNFNVMLNPNAYPFPISGGTITGSICGAPWTVTGGSLGSALHITGHKNPPVGGCASTINVVGNYNAPSAYIGTYGFNGSSTMFSHHTLFLGYNKPTCP
jgi:hypothetical protein